MLDQDHVDISIIIVNWNTRDLLSQCLESVYATVRDLTFEVVVVDNASSDGSAEMIRERFPQARLIENDVNSGFARANNQGIAQSHGQFLLLLNSDTILQAEAVAKMVAFMKAYPMAGIVGAYIRNPDGTPQRCFGAFPTVVSESICAWGLDSRLPFARWFVARPIEPNGHLETDWVLGAALMIRRKTLEQIGVLDENYFMYSEEIDLCYRVKKAGWRNFILGTAHIIHLGGQSTRQMSATMKAQLFLSKLRYFRKHRGRAAAAFLNVMFGASILSKRWVYYLYGKTEMSNLWVETWTHFGLKEPRGDAPDRSFSAPRQPFTTLR
jgi:GT2 family glycosyltransferase